MQLRHRGHNFALPTKTTIHLEDISSLVYCLTMFDVCHMFVLKYYLRPIFNSFLTDITLYSITQYNSCAFHCDVLRDVKHVRLTCVFNKLMLMLMDEAQGYGGNIFLSVSMCTCSYNYVMGYFFILIFPGT